MSRLFIQLFALLLISFTVSFADSPVRPNEDIIMPDHVLGTYYGGSDDHKGGTPLISVKIEYAAGKVTITPSGYYKKKTFSLLPSEEKGTFFLNQNQSEFIYFLPDSLGFVTEEYNFLGAKIEQSDIEK